MTTGTLPQVSCIRKGVKDTNSGRTSLQGSTGLTDIDLICFLTPGGERGDQGQADSGCICACVSGRGRRC